tara:strand:+ start:2010 stop:2627 length:618 start_codon:yes stop_codon:yes gene_type:complete
MQYYTYAYLREDRTPYYIGKGQGNRIFKKGKKQIKPPKDESRIIFLKQNLTEEEAFKHERYMIAVFGRKDLGTGILHNRTDGGEGASGAIRSLEFKLNLSKINKNKILSKEHKEKIGNAQKGDKNHNYGKSASKETREKMSKAQLGEKHPRANWWKITFLNGNTIEICGMPSWAKENNYGCANIHSVYLGNRKKHKDIIKVEKIR